MTASEMFDVINILLKHDIEDMTNLYEEDDNLTEGQKFERIDYAKAKITEVFHTFETLRGRVTAESVSDCTDIWNVYIEPELDQLEKESRTDMVAANIIITIVHSKAKIIKSCSSQLGSENNCTFYHGTPASRADSIKRHGFLAHKPLGTNEPEGVYVAKEFEEASGNSQAGLEASIAEKIIEKYGRYDINGNKLDYNDQSDMIYREVTAMSEPRSVIFTIKIPCDWYDDKTETVWRDIPPQYIIKEEEIRYHHYNFMAKQVTLKIRQILDLL